MTMPSAPTPPDSTTPLARRLAEMEAERVHPVAIIAVRAVHDRLVTAVAIGRTITPAGEKVSMASVIDIARLVYDVESDILGGMDDDEPEEGPDDPPQDDPAHGPRP